MFLLPFVCDVLRSDFVVPFALIFRVEHDTDTQYAGFDIHKLFFFFKLC